MVLAVTLRMTGSGLGPMGDEREVVDTEMADMMIVESQAPTPLAAEEITAVDGDRNEVLNFKDFWFMDGRTLKESSEHEFFIWLVFHVSTFYHKASRTPCFAILVFRQCRGRKP